MKVFVTGHKGYIGTHLVSLLKEFGHTVTGCDLNLFQGCEWNQVPMADTELIKDIRKVTERDLAGHDCVMHLASISNDPMGKLNEDVTFSINRDGTIHLAKLAKAAGVPRFLFAASCAEYGRKGTDSLDENSPFDPLSAYAKSKVEAEEVLKNMSDGTFCVVTLRNATSFGSSSMLRLDLVANNLLASAYALGEIRVMSDGTPWRPVVHCKDIARAFIAFMTAPTDIVCGRAVNIGANAENYQIFQIAETVKKIVPKAPIIYTGEIGGDARSYRVNFDLLGKLLPDFKIAYPLQAGLEELHEQFVQHRFIADDFLGDRYFRLRAIKRKFDNLVI